MAEKKTEIKTSTATLAGGTKVTGPADVIDKIKATDSKAQASK